MENTETRNGVTMVKCILRAQYDDGDEYHETLYNGIPEAMSIWASGYKHEFLFDASLMYADSRQEIPDKVTDMYYNRYYYGRFIFDENGEEIGRKSWSFVHLDLYFPPTSYMKVQVIPKKTGVLIKK